MESTKLHVRFSCKSIVVEQKYEIRNAIDNEYIGDIANSIPTFMRNNEYILQCVYLVGEPSYSNMGQERQRGIGAFVFLANMALISQVAILCLDICTLEMLSKVPIPYL